MRAPAGGSSGRAPCGTAGVLPRGREGSVAGRSIRPPSDQTLLRTSTAIRRRLRHCCQVRTRKRRAGQSPKRRFVQPRPAWMRNRRSPSSTPSRNRRRPPPLIWSRKLLPVTARPGRVWRHGKARGFRHSGRGSPTAPGGCGPGGWVRRARWCWLRAWRPGQPFGYRPIRPSAAQQYRWRRRRASRGPLSMLLHLRGRRSQRRNPASRAIRPAKPRTRKSAHPQGYLRRTHLPGRIAPPRRAISSPTVLRTRTKRLPRASKPRRRDRLPARAPVARWVLLRQTPSRGGDLSEPTGLGRCSVVVPPQRCLLQLPRGRPRPPE